MERVMNVAPAWLALAIESSHIGFTALVFTYFLISHAITICMAQSEKLRALDKHVYRDMMMGLISAAAFCYGAELFTLFMQGLLAGVDSPQHLVLYLLFSALFFGGQLVTLHESTAPVWYPYYGTWIIALWVNLFLLMVPNIIIAPQTNYDAVLITLQVIRTGLFIALPALYFVLRNISNNDLEAQALLAKQGQTSNGYGAIADTNNSQDSDTAVSSDSEADDRSFIAHLNKGEALMQKRLQEDGNWLTYLKGFTIFIPYVWPVHDRALQIRAVLVGCCLLLKNALNVLVPWSMGVVIDHLTNYNKNTSSLVYALFPAVIYTMLLFISGSTGIGWLRKWLWLPVEQYSHQALSTAAHAHLMSLSSDFHDSKTTSELTQAIHGGRSVSTLLESVCFEFLPMLIDLAVAFAYLTALYGPYMGLLMLVVSFSYLYATSKLTARRAETRKEWMLSIRREGIVAQQSLDGWATANSFSMIPYEERRYADAVDANLLNETRFILNIQVNQAVLGLILSFGLLGALWLGVWQIAYHGMSVGQFAALLFYWNSLTNPLSYFANTFRHVTFQLMEAERLLELFQTKPTVADLPNAQPLELSQGVVKFDHVSFAYNDRQQTLKDVSFEVPAGKTVALVGETGSGKSTILKLIDRYYDIKAGSITIDGQDIRGVTLQSLRNNIGVVAQDPILFDDSIMNNLRYAKLAATDEEVFNACKAAAVHDKIMTFPDNYNTKVGGRGIKLSGGEKQRIAIARAMLKQANIVLLDEATSAVDTETEQKIQEGFAVLCKNRTTFIVAHRLSTIMNADHILVVTDGQIVEQGSHDRLLESLGKYYDLWSKQFAVKAYAPPAIPRYQTSTFASRAKSISPQNSVADIANINDDNRGRKDKEPAQGTHAGPKARIRSKSDTDLIEMINDLTPRRIGQQKAKFIEIKTHSRSNSDNSIGSNKSAKYTPKALEPFPAFNTDPQIKQKIKLIEIKPHGRSNSDTPIGSNKLAKYTPKALEPFPALITHSQTKSKAKLIEIKSHGRSNSDTLIGSSKLAKYEPKALEPFPAFIVDPLPSFIFPQAKGMAQEKNAEIDLRRRGDSDNSIGSGTSGKAASKLPIAIKPLSPLGKVLEPAKTKTTDEIVRSRSSSDESTKSAKTPSKLPVTIRQPTTQENGKEPVQLTHAGPKARSRSNSDNSTTAAATIASKPPVASKPTTTQDKVLEQTKTKHIQAHHSNNDNSTGNGKTENAGPKVLATIQLYNEVSKLKANAPTFVSNSANRSLLPKMNMSAIKATQPLKTVGHDENTVAVQNSINPTAIPTAIPTAMSKPTGLSAIIKAAAASKPGPSRRQVKSDFPDATASKIPQSRSITVSSPAASPEKVHRRRNRHWRLKKKAQV